MTKEKKALWLRLLAKFYGIEGQLDEYKEKELNRIGNRGFMFSSIYSFMSTSFCFLRFDQFSETDLMILVSVNMIVYFLLIPTYLSTAITLAGLTEIDLTETEYPKARRKAITRGIRTIFTYGIGMFFFESGIDVLF